MVTINHCSGTNTAVVCGDSRINVLIKILFFLFVYTEIRSGTFVYIQIKRWAPYNPKTQRTGKLISIRVSEDELKTN